MATVDIVKKYANFIAPRTQIFVNKQDIQEKYGISASLVNVEEVVGSKAKFSFSIEDPKCEWIKNRLFELNNSVQIRMGYANTFETVVKGEIASVKSIFPASGSPQIEVSGDSDKANAATRIDNKSPAYSLAYGRTLYSFTSTVIAEKQKSIDHCSAECVGLPDIKPGGIVVLAGLATKFNQTYRVEKVQHSIDSSGYRTRFEARMQPQRTLLKPKNERVF